MWNLFLAWIPFVCALGAYLLARRRGGLAVVLLGSVWLLFFPNAPYMLTDFIHLGDTPAVPLWYDALMLASFAWTALVLGFASLYLMQMIWQRAVGPRGHGSGCSRRSRSAASASTSGASSASTAGMPSSVRACIAHVIRDDLENPLEHPRLIASLLVLTASLTVAYTILYCFAGARLELERRTWDPPPGRASRAPRPSLYQVPSSSAASAAVGVSRITFSQLTQRSCSRTFS